MKAYINCGCEDCCKNTKYGELALHRITITKEDGEFRARGHAIEDYELPGGETWEDIEWMYCDQQAWRLEFED